MIHYESSHGGYICMATIECPYVEASAIGIDSIQTTCLVKYKTSSPK